jgi:hypothetical protein
MLCAVEAKASSTSASDGSIPQRLASRICSFSLMSSSSTSARGGALWAAPDDTSSSLLRWSMSSWVIGTPLTKAATF